MRKEIIIRIHVKSEKCQTKAMKVAATVSGVESVTLTGGDKSLLLVIGDGVDSNKLTKKLKKKVGTAEIVELRTRDTFDVTAGSKEMAMVARSPAYSHWQYATAPSPYAYHHHYHPSPMTAARGYGTSGSSYSRVLALSHPANYSPLVEKHDYYPMDRPSNTSYKAVPRRESDSNRCSIL